MSLARDLIHQATGCNDADEFDEAACARITELLNQVEDDRLHAEAVKLRESAAKLNERAPDRTGLLIAARRIDPYEEIDGDLYSKADAKKLEH